MSVSGTKMRSAVVIIVLTLTLAHIASALIQEIPLPTNIQACFDQGHTKGNLTEIIGEKLLWHCIHGSLWKQAREMANNTIPDVAMKWFADLIYKSMREAEHRSRTKRQAQRRPLRVRREYRMLSDAERNLFHRAINMLKRDTTIPPNRFDALGRLHELLGERAHDGPNFFGWHRFHLVVAENALREQIPGMTIPYWDSTLDGRLVDPRSAVIWAPHFMGNCNGRLRTGPFTGWATPDAGPLLRNCGDGGTMMNWTSIRDSFSRRHLEEITHPNADPKHNLEDHHGEPHLWIGGHMSPQALAAYDPVFYVFHSFIDLLWELFRRIQRRRGIDPTTDYPRVNTGTAGHGYNDASGFGNLLNRHALSDIFTTEMYTYQLPPTCTRERPTCGSPYIRCDTSGRRPRCVSASIFDTPSDEVFNADDFTARRKRSTKARKPRYLHNIKHLDKYLKEFQKAADLKCQPENINDRYANIFSIDGVTDPDRWAYIPVSIIYRNEHSKLSNSLDVAATYPKCQTGQSLPTRVYVESNGLNYRGFFKEIAHVQKDIPTFSTMSYIGVRMPTHISSQLVVSAYDSCGRACKTFCRTGVNNKYHQCAGALRITQEMPKQYGRNVTDAIADLWTTDTGTGIPELNEGDIFLRIFCDQQPVWLWNK